jgi:hypothetical protein
MSAPRGPRAAPRLPAHHAGEHGGDEFAHAVADQRMRPRTQCQQPPCQRVLRARRSRAAWRPWAPAIADRRRTCARAGRNRHAPRRRPCSRRRRRRTPRRSRAACRPMPAYCAPWPGNISTSCGAREPVRPLTRRGESALRRAATASACRCCGHHHAAEGVGLAADASVWATSASGRSGCASRCAGELLGGQWPARLRSVPTAAAAGRPLPAARPAQRRLFDDDVRVGAAHAEGADARAARQVGARPRLQAAGHVEGRAREVDGRVRHAEVRGRRHLFVVQRQRGLDEAGRARRRDHVAHVALERAERAEAEGVGVLCVGHGQCLDLDRVAHRRGGAVRFDVRDAARVDIGRRQRGTDHRGLAVDAGRREAGLGAAVVVHAGAAQHRVDGVAVGLRVGQALEQHHRRAVAEHRALRLASKLRVWPSGESIEPSL